MKTITSVLFITFILFNVTLFSQIINLNPDPDGEPWIAGDLPVVTPEIQAILDEIPELVLSPISASTTLIDVVDNSLHMYMRPIFIQQGASCGQASGVAYTYTYEINWLRNLPANDEMYEDNWYPTHYTWNFFNNGMGGGSWYYEGWDVIKENGCPNVPTWGEGMGGWRIWMDGYDKYNSGMYNKLDSYYYIDVSTPEGLETFKHWINDHNAGIGIGGLGCFATYMSGFIWDYLPPESNAAGVKIMSDWSYSESGFHAMTFVGYDDGIKYDINNDGFFKNDEDNNGDGIVDMLDWEIGALKVANSSGLSWPGGPLSNGYSYLPYRLLPLERQNPDTPYNTVPVLWDKKVHVIEVSDENPPLFVLKTKIGYNKRSRLKLNIGYANNANQSTPLEDFSGFSSFNFQGGGLPMNGIDNEPIEIGLDYGYWYLEKDFGKVFFIIEEEGLGTPGIGEVYYLSLVDYRWGEEFELYCDQSNVHINTDGETTLFIDYDLIPHEDNITENLNLFSDMVSRFNPTVSNNAVLTIENGVEIDMYNSQINIESGATLIIEDNVTFTGKSGLNEIIIDGNIVIGDNVAFVDINGILLNNESLQTTFNESNLTRSFLMNKGEEFNLTDCDFNDCDVLWSTRGNINIINSNFNNTWLLLDNLYGAQSNVINIINNNLYGSESEPSGIFLSDYDWFRVESNYFNGCDHGIQIYESGFGVTGNQNVFDNEIINCENKGIQIYDSKVSLAENEVFNNEYGIWLVNRSNVALVGNAAALSNSETQQVYDNTSYELYASAQSFPWYFKYNVIIDEDNLGNPSDPLIYYDTEILRIEDISYNCWGENFDPSEDLFPSSGFIWSPTWCPPGTVYQNSVVEQLYADALTEFEDSNFLQAQSEFEYIINQYPTSKFSAASMKELFSLERYIDSNYLNLKQYFLKNDSIISDSILRSLGEFLANKCDVELEEWQSAIDHYESIIENPNTPTDSIFAIIDLGYTYLRMGNSGNKTYYYGNLTEYIPQSREQFINNRQYLLSLLPFEKENTENIVSDGEIGKLLQNAPNPFSDKTTVQFELTKIGIIKVKIYNNIGIEVMQIEDCINEPGRYKIEINADKLITGIYYYSLELNNQVLDTKKMILIK